VKALAAAALLLLLAFPARADVLIDNVNGLTLDAEGRVVHFNGVLVGDDGRIEQVLDRRDKRPGNVDYRFDGKGRALMPGLIDSHVQLMKLGLSLLTREDVGATDLPAGERKLPPPRPEDRDVAFGKAQQLLLSRGITAVADMGTTIEDWQTYRRAGDLGRLNLRIIAYAAGPEAMALIGGPGPTPWLYEDRLRLNGLFLAVDGTLESRSAALKAPYADNTASKSRPALSETQLKNLMSRGAIDNFQVAVSASGDAAIGTVLDAIEELKETYRGDRRWRIERAQLVDPADLLRLGQFGVCVSMQPQLSASDRALAEARLGADRLAGVQAWKSLTDAGAMIAFGSAAPDGPPEPFAAMATAYTRQDADGQPFGGWQPQERLTREAALAALTTGAAHALFADGRLGRIARGEKGDFLLVDRDPMLATPDELREIRVLQTWVGGKLVYEAKDLPADGR
jgi:hypothetical protein